MSKDGPGHANTRAAAAQWVNATNAPRCATQVSDREKSFIAEAARVRLVLDVWQSVWRGLPALAAVPVCCCMQPACMLRLFRFLRVPALVLAVENRTKMLYKCSPHSTPFYDAETINQPNPTQPPCPYRRGSSGFHSLYVAWQARKNRAALEDLWKLSIQAERDFQDAKQLKKFREQQAAREAAYKEHQAQQAADFAKVRGNIASRKTEQMSSREQKKAKAEEEADLRRKERIRHENHLREIARKKRQKEDERVQQMKADAMEALSLRTRLMEHREKERKEKQAAELKEKRRRIERARQRLQKEAEEQVAQLQAEKDAALMNKRVGEIKTRVWNVPGRLWETRGGATAPLACA